MKLIRRPSPHFNARKAPIDMIVIHAMEHPDIDEACACLDGYRVSAHFLIARDGSVVRCVDEDKRAWHAGVSSWRGVSEDLNSHSIGIEFLCDSFSRKRRVNFTKKQVAVGVRLCRRLMRDYGIPAVNIVRHSDIAPERKSDPGRYFPWRMFLGSLTR
ncbi:MAG: N-acetylmuramoyl-L-alanine amidase [Alphaproteobacteria bacterium]|nr:N-acetylmuramoyl-L-alanine amidase [Alphaproteobacteria bacterium]